MKHPLLIPIERLQAGPLHLKDALAPELLDLTDEEHEYEFTDPVQVDLTFQLVVQEVLAQGALDTVATAGCVRCLKPTRVPLHVPVTETWFHASAEQRRELEATGEHAVPERTYDGAELDVREDLRELIMSELPERTFCQADCKGLCAGCGANLNEEACRCDKAAREEDAEARVPEWKQALKKLRLNPEKAD